MSMRQWGFRTGGDYRYMHRGDDDEYWFNGTYHTVRDDEFLVQTFEFEGTPDRSTLNTRDSRTSAADAALFAAGPSARTSTPVMGSYRPAWKAA
jgi:uncharacterized protein YndB with AHSA1/START domain